MPIRPETKNLKCPRTWEEEWADFQDHHQHWWERILANHPAVYAMTHCLINGLRDSKKHFINKDAEHAERAFLDLCAFRGDIVGVRSNGSPIAYPLWDPDDLVMCPGCRNSKNTLRVNPNPRYGEKAPPIETDHDQLENALNERANDFIEQAKEIYQARATLFRRNRLRHAGFLITKSEYREAIDDFARRSREFDQSDVLNLISGKDIPLPGMQLLADTICKGDGPFARFLENLGQFAANQCIVGFVTWDLPLIQIPLEGFPADLVFLYRGPDAIVSHFPVYFGGESDRSEGNRTSEAQLREYPLDPKRRTLSPTSLTSEDETRFRMYFLETAVNQRFPNPERGLVSCMLEAFKAHFRCKERHVKKLRQAYKTPR